jgi:hypothetical protein
MNLVAIIFATQPVWNATWAAHALYSDQLPSTELVEFSVSEKTVPEVFSFFRKIFTPVCGC